jgi:hypothetical protein
MTHICDPTHLSISSAIVNSCGRLSSWLRTDLEEVDSLATLRQAARAVPQCVTAKLDAAGL